MISVAHPRYGDPTCSVCGAITVPDGSPFPQYAWKCMSCGSRDAAKPEPSKEEPKKAESMERRLVETKIELAKLRADNKALLTEVLAWFGAHTDGFTSPAELVQKIKSVTNQ